MGFQPVGLPAAFAEVGAGVIEEAGRGSELARTIHASYSTFLERVDAWSGVGEGAYVESRLRTRAGR